MNTREMLKVLGTSVIKIVVTVHPLNSKTSNATGGPYILVECMNTK